MGLEGAALKFQSIFDDMCVKNWFFKSFFIQIFNKLELLKTTLISNQL